ncbi:MAG: glycosyltransferase family 2 protein [Prevotellaceae bacterium]|nr:glycosyltransferase family 2 protein [Prevotellaceae bacterium]
MLSVLIPTYNYDCYLLADCMQRQLQASRRDYELIVVEDGSDDVPSMMSNSRVAELPYCRYIRRKDNVGRAAIKNFLAREAKGDWLLYMDSDAAVTEIFYITRLLQAVDTAGTVGVIMGGLRHEKAMPSREVSLRHRYERAADRHRSAANRSRHPYRNVTSFNLCVRRDVMLDIPFDERCRNYGYEDALFGVMLKERGVEVLHIDNPLVHLGLEPNAVFLEKTETALRTLDSLGMRMLPYSHVGRTMQRLRRWRMAWAVRRMYSAFGGAMRRNLLGKRPCLTVFALYKLGYLCALQDAKSCDSR